MDDDLNTSVALAALHGFLPEVNTRLDDLGDRPITEAERDAGLRVFERIDTVFNLLALADSDAEVGDDDRRWVEDRLAEREEARKNRDFARADALRDEVVARGYQVEDTPQGTRWVRSS
jgi:cysteinyl-tRNA synthetase